MGNKQSTVQNNYIQELSNINEEELDISRIDRLQIKAIKEVYNKIKEIESKKSGRIFYKLPAIQLCSWSLF